MEIYNHMIDRFITMAKKLEELDNKKEEQIAA